MSLLWKKPKSSRISRFMADFQQSPKRGGSLVIETGFPASLIDLFVKNRDRLKKSSSKRHKRQTQTASIASSPQQPRLSPPSPQPQISVPTMDLDVVKIPIGKDTVVSGGLTAENKHASDNNGCGGCVLMAFKFIIVTILTLSTKKKLTIGITLSTLALLFLELVAARVFTLLKPVSIHNKTVISSKKIETFDSKHEIRLPKSYTKRVSPLNPKPNLAAAKTEKSNSIKKVQEMFTIRDLLLKDEITSKSSKLKSKIVKKLMSYKKKKKTMKNNTKQEEKWSLVSVEKPKRDQEEEKSNPPLMESKEDKTKGIVVIVIVLVGLLSGKLIAIATLTLSCFVLRYTSLSKH